MRRTDEMEAPATPAQAPKRVRVNRFLPYWAVFQADFKQTVDSWVYRVWVLLSLFAAVGLLLYRFGAYRVAGMVQPASELMSDLMHWTVLGSVTLIIVLTGGSISAERGTMADSILSRGISRYQYFLGKWHARLVMVLGTFCFMAILALVGSHFFLEEDLELGGSLVTLATITALFAVVVTCGVTVSAISNSTVLGIALLWVALYGVGFGMTLLPVSYAPPVR